jgi:hypothetical protein
MKTGPVTRGPDVQSRHEPRLSPRSKVGSWLASPLPRGPSGSRRNTARQEASESLRSWRDVEPRLRPRRTTGSRPSARWAAARASRRRRVGRRRPLLRRVAGDALGAQPARESRHLRAPLERGRGDHPRGHRGGRHGPRIRSPAVHGGVASEVPPVLLADVPFGRSGCSGRRSPTPGPSTVPAGATRWRFEES